MTTSCAPGRGGAIAMRDAVAQSGLSKGQIIGRAHRLKLRDGRPAIIQRPEPALKPAPDRVAVGCQWPMWDDQERPTHQFCGAERGNPLHPYCGAHAKTAYAVAPSAHSIRMTELHAKRREARDRMAGR